MFNVKWRQIIGYLQFTFLFHKPRLVCLLDHLFLVPIAVFTSHPGSPSLTYFLLADSTRLTNILQTNLSL